jgi:uncharacterized membrane protein
VGGNLVDKVTERAGGLSDRLTDYADKGPSRGKESREGGSGKKDTGGNGGDESGGGEGGSIRSKIAEKREEGASPLKAGLAGTAEGVKDKVKGLFGGGGGRNKAFKFNNIVESFDIGAPVDVVYAAWTDYKEWPGFMKKVEQADLDEDDAKVNFKGQVFWSHRQWQTTIKDQVPGKRIQWDSSGAKGHISGVVTFHELGEDLTRVVLVLEYHPQGFMEKTANLWRAANRRVRLELKFFVRHVMTDTVLHPDDVEGFQVEIHDGEQQEGEDAGEQGDEEDTGGEDVDAEEQDSDAQDSDAQDSDQEEGQGNGQKTGGRKRSRQPAGSRAGRSRER